jgi:hypothetical protein
VQCPKCSVVEQSRSAGQQSAVRLAPTLQQVLALAGYKHSQQPTSSLASFPGRRNLSASTCAFPVQAVICTYPCPPMSSAALRRTSLLRERGLSDLKRRGLGLMEVATESKSCSLSPIDPSIHPYRRLFHPDPILSSCLVRPRLFVRLQVKLCATYPHTFPLIIRKSGVEI